MLSATACAMSITGVSDWSPNVFKQSGQAVTILSGFSIVSACSDSRVICVLSA